MTEKPKETRKEELECPKKYVYDTGIIFECEDNIKVEIIGEDVVDLLNEQDEEIKEISDALDNMVDFKNKYRDKYKQLKKEKEQLKKDLHKIKVVNEMLSMDFANSEHQLWEENEELKQRNKNQAEQLGRLYSLIEAKDWRSLYDIIDDFKRNDEQLRKEWGTYGD